MQDSAFMNGSEFNMKVLHCLPYTNCTHIRQQREREVNICEECTELLQNTIEPVFDVLRNSTDCIEKYHDRPPILHNLQKHVKSVSRKQLVKKLKQFALEFQMITEVWTMHVGTPLCPNQDLGRHFTRILCLLKPVSHARRNCIITESFLGPLDTSRTIEYTSEYLKEVYIILRSFLSTLK